MMPSPTTILQKFWGYDQFRSPQLEIIQTLIAQNDALIIMSTGGGKSICFQVPALVHPGLTIVVSPLVALMENQVQGLRSRKIPAALLHNQQSKEERKKVFWQLETQQLKLLYVSPETLLSPPVWSRLCQPDLVISSLILDEAHCLTQWGDTFRPAYFRLGAVRAALLHHKPPQTRINLAAFTATANPDAQKMITHVLQLNQPKIFQGSPYRENLFLAVQSTHTPHDRRQKLKQFLQQQAQESGLVYVRTRRESEELSQWLQQLGFSVTAYHAGLSAPQRRQIEQAWLERQLQFVVCTNAFGMGIDHPEVRWIVHFHAPLLLAEYLQEIGRAGRDGKPAQALMLVSSWLDNTDRQRWQYFQGIAIEQQKNAQKLIQQLPARGEVDRMGKRQPEMLLALSILQRQGRLIWHDPHRYEITPTPQGITSMAPSKVDLPNWLNTKSCRWLALLEAFGDENYRSVWRCGHCDRCCR
jgi:ATP-dependent DNA helicase RecQ